MSTLTTLRRGLAASMLVSALGLFGSACGPKYPNCEADGDCKAGEFCVNKLCQQCRTDADCQTGQACNGNVCEDIPDFCDDSKPCGSGQDCVGNRCQTPQSESLVRETQPTTGCQLQVVYFAYDSANLEPSARDGIAKNAQCIREKGAGGVRITGHTDPRGTEEYNLALGDRRAKSVEQYLSSLGVDRKSLSTASMGEELARGEDEGGWTQDRRVEFTAK
ncbi:MAG: OmpA family protein [Polyangiales bacterium]